MNYSQIPIYINVQKLRDFPLILYFKKYAIIIRDFQATIVGKSNIALKKVHNKLCEFGLFLRYARKRTEKCFLDSLCFQAENFLLQAGS